MKTSLKTLAVALALSLVPAAASAQEVDIEAEHTRGLQLREQHQDQAALDLFRALYLRTREPRALARMALAEGALGLWDLAEEHMSLAVSARRDRWIRSNRRGLRENLAVIREHVGRAEVLCSTPGASLYVRGEQRGSFPLAQPVRLPAGAVEIEVRAPGFQSARQTLNISPGALAQVVVVLAPEAPPPPVVAEPAPPPPVVEAPPPVTCPEGQSVSADTAGHCCWPGQVYSITRASCLGPPTCPMGLVADGETCTPPPPPSPPVNPFPTDLAPAAPPTPPPPSHGPNRFQLSVFGGYGLNDIHGPVVGGRIGYSIIGHIYLGAYGFYSFGGSKPSQNLMTSALPFALHLPQRSSYFVGGELGVEITPGLWVIRPSVALGSYQASREWSMTSNDTTVSFPPTFGNCEEPNFGIAPGLTVMAPIARVFYLSVDARYLFVPMEVSNISTCTLRDPWNGTLLGASTFPGSTDRNNGFIFTGELGFRF